VSPFQAVLVASHPGTAEKRLMGRLQGAKQNREMENANCKNSNGKLVPKKGELWCVVWV